MGRIAGIGEGEKLADQDEGDAVVAVDADVDVDDVDDVVDADDAADVAAGRGMSSSCCVKDPPLYSYHLSLCLSPSPSLSLFL